LESAVKLDPTIGKTMKMYNIYIKNKTLGSLGILLISLLCSQTLIAKTDIEYFTSQRNIDNNYPFSDAVQVGDLLFLSGKIGFDSKKGKLVEGGIKTETKQTMDNIKGSLSIYGYTMNDLVKCTVMLADIGDWPTFNEVYKTYFPRHFPARSAFATNGLALGAKVEVECIAAKSE
jgi:2-iminobutanoate/2-iminopropanoate deaminase